MCKNSILEDRPQLEAVVNEMTRVLWSMIPEALAFYGFQILKRNY